MNRFVFAGAVLTIAVLVGWAVNTVTSDTSTLTRNPGDVTLVECLNSRAYPSRASANLGRVVCGAATGVSTPTFTPSPTSTSVPTATPTVTPPTPVPTPGETICGAECGVPRNFCDTWTGGWCNDYRAVGDTAFEVGFDTAAQGVSFDCLDATTPGYEPSMLSGTLPFPCIFTKHEHFMTRMESGSFGIAMMRFHRPVDLTAARHIHLEADLKPSNTRNYFRVMLSPDLTKRDVDDRGGDPYPRTFLQAWFRNGDVQGTVCRNLVCDGDSYPWGDAFGSAWPPFSPLADNVRVPIDIFLAQTSIRIDVGGRQMVNDTFAPLGFDLGYLYLSQVSYNPCKDGRCAPADSIAHWDNVAVDGPTLDPNSITPRGWRDVVFNAYSATSCSVNGVAAQSMGPVTGYTWVTWVARLLDNDSPVAIACAYSYVADGSNVPRGIEIVK